MLEEELLCSVHLPFPGKVPSLGFVTPAIAV